MDDQAIRLGPAVLLKGTRQRLLVTHQNEPESVMLAQGSQRRWNDGQMAMIPTHGIEGDRHRLVRLLGLISQCVPPCQLRSLLAERDQSLLTLTTRRPR